jgi:hypothetical protein
LSAPGRLAWRLAAEAQARQIDHLLVGKPMEFWEKHMPDGMYLRSACDWHLDPRNDATIERFLAEQGLTPAAVEPLSLAFYLTYAQLVSGAEADCRAAALRPKNLT